MSPIKQIWSTAGIGKRMSIAVLTILLVAIILTSGIVYNVFNRSYSESIEQKLVAITTANADSFMEWIEARQDEVEFIASLNTVKDLNEPGIKNIFTKIGELNGFYDSIIFVDTVGAGVVSTLLVPEEG